MDVNGVPIANLSSLCVMVSCPGPLPFLRSNSTMHHTCVCLQTKTIGGRNCTACFSLANIFNQSTNKSFGARLQSKVKLIY